MSFVVHAFSDTNKGLFREINEDSLLVGKTVFAVADGMGGHAAGEVASQAAITPLRAIDDTTYRDPEAATDALADAVREANTLVLSKAAEDPELRGMGTTLTTVMVRGQRLHLAHVGDSRAYLLRDGLLEMLTEDHTLVNELVKDNRLTLEEAHTHPQRSLITRAIGSEQVVDVDFLADPLELIGGDQILLCSDGLTGPVSESLIAEILSTESDGTLACQRLIDAANAGGGPDNITCVLLRVEGDGPPSAQQVAAPRLSSDDDATAELGDPAGLDARRLAELSQGNPDYNDPATDHQPGRGRRIGAAVLGVLLILALLGAGAVLLLNRQVFVGVDADDQVGIYRGIQGDVIGISLSTLVERQAFGLEDLPERLHQGLDDGVNFPTVPEAETYVEQTLLPATQEVGQPSPAPTASEEQ